MSEEIEDLLAELESDGKRPSAESRQVDAYNAQEELIKSLYGFVSKQLEAINRQEAFRSVVVEALIDKVQDREVTVGQLLQLYEIISEQGRDSSTALLNLFKGNGSGGGNFLGSAAAADSEEGYGGLDPKERRAIDKLTRALESTED